MANGSRIVRNVIALALALFVAVVATALFVVYPRDLLDLAGVVLVVIVVLLAVPLTRSVGRSLYPAYDVAEVAVTGPISRTGVSPRPAGPRSVPVDRVVEQIDRANDDGTVEALLVRLNTPGGEIVPSDDVRAAIERFEGPTIAYATDVCASGGYWIGAGCDEFWSREASVVGSIGVSGSRINATELAAKLGLEYERFTAGEYKDAGTPLRDLEDDERAYLQGLVDEWYAHFVESVSDGRDLDPSFVRQTEARVYLGESARELGLIDAVGTREDVEESIADRLGRESITVREFEARIPIAGRLRIASERLAYAVGTGLAERYEIDGFRLRS